MIILQAGEALHRDRYENRIEDRVRNIGHIGVGDYFMAMFRLDDTEQAARKPISVESVTEYPGTRRLPLLAIHLLSDDLFSELRTEVKFGRDGIMRSPAFSFREAVGSKPIPVSQAYLLMPHESVLLSNVLNDPSYEPKNLGD